MSGPAWTRWSATMRTMTELMTRPILRVKATAEPPRRPMAVSALVAGVVAAVGGLVVCVALAVGIWFSGETGSFGGAVRVGAFGWLVSNGTGIDVGGTSITAIPLGFLMCWAYLLYRVGRWSGASSAVRHGGDVATGAVAIAVGYAGAGLAVRAVAQTDSADVNWLRGLLVLTLVATVCGGLGIVVGSESSEPVLAMLPPQVRAVATGAVAGFATMIAASAALLVASLVMHFSQAVTLQEGLAQDTIGGIALTLIAVAVVPNGVLCAGAFLAGPGFAVGTGTIVAPGDVSLGRLPGLPLLAALPSDGDQGWWQPLLILMPVVAGAVAGVVALRRDPVFGLDQAALRGALSGLIGGLVFGVSTWLATGAIGPGRMQDVGPAVLPTTLVCALAFLVGGAVAAGSARWWESFRA